jgi:hypothetical protein
MEEPSELGSNLSQFDQHDKKKQLKQDIQNLQLNSFFTEKHELKEETIMERLIDVCLSANSLMSFTSDGESFKTIEMSLNKEDVLLDRSKVIVIKMRGLLLMIPFQITKVEIRLRNALFLNE